MAYLLAITGPDGSGKSTVTQALCSSWNQEKGEGFAISTSIWDSLEGAGLFSKEVIGRYLASLKGPSRALFLFHSLLNGLALAQEKKPKIILLDSYFYKYFAAEVAYGIAPELLSGAARAFPVPNKTFYLEIDPRTAFQRKEGKVSTYESGGGQFEDFQRSLLRRWQDLEREFGPWEHVSYGFSVSEIVSKIRIIVDREIL